MTPLRPPRRASLMAFVEYILCREYLGGKHILHCEYCRPGSRGRATAVGDLSLRRRQRERVVLVRDRPASALLAQPDGEAKAVVGIFLQLLLGAAPEQCVRERNVVPGRDVERGDLERGTLLLPLEERRPGLAIGLLAAHLVLHSGR